MATNDPHSISSILADTQIRPKNLLADFPEIYLLKMAIQSSTIPLICTIAAPFFLLGNMIYSLTGYSASREIHLELTQAWLKILKKDTSAARNFVLTQQHGQQIIQEEVRQEMTNPASRLRIIILLVLIALVMIGIPMFLAMQNR